MLRKWNNNNNNNNNDDDDDDDDDINNNNNNDNDDDDNNNNNTLCLNYNSIHFHQDILVISLDVSLITTVPSPQK
jgi:hypothetical protein